MKKRVLGRTGLEVSELGLGGLFVSTYGADYDKAREAIHAAIAAGMNYIDTAPGYGNSEEVLGKALADVDAPVIFSTKLGGRPKPFEPKNKDHLRQSVQESLRLLGVKQIDMLLIHEPDREGQYDWWTDFVNAEGPVMEVLDELKAEGIIKYTGLGGTTVYELARLCDTGKFDVVLTAFNYSLLWREAEMAIIPAAVKHNMGIIAGSPLQQGALAVRYDAEVANGAGWMAPQRRAQFKALYALCDDLKLNVADLANRFVLSNPHIGSVLTGVRSAEEVAWNVAAADQGPLPADVLKRLDEIRDLCPMRPYLEPFGLRLRDNTRRPINVAS